MKKREKKKGKMNGFINGVEKVGNKLPHPFWLFTIFSLITMVLSFLLSKSGTSVDYMTSVDGKLEMTQVSVVNLLTFDYMREFIPNLIKNYITFPPLGVVLVMMMGVALIEQTGLLNAFIKKLMIGAPDYLITAILVFVGINSSIASDAGILFTPAIGAAIFASLGRNPWAGIIVGYAAASGGLSASLFISNSDVLLAGITESVATGMNIEGSTTPVMNYYFMAAMTILLTIFITLVAEKFLIKYLGNDGNRTFNKDASIVELSDLERKGLKYSGYGFILFIAIMLILTLPKNAFFRNENGGFLPKSPLISSVMPIIFMFFFIVGTLYGIGAKTITKSSDIPKHIQEELKGMTSIFPTMFTASMFVTLFNASKLATILAVHGSNWLQSLQIPSVLLIILLILLCTFLNLFIGSSSAKWLILAPIFVPMFAMMGFSPALTQVAYRIGDGATNIISPIAGAVPVILGLLEDYKPDNYEKEIGLGTMISLELPFTFTLLIVQTISLIIWFVLGIPLGPGAGTVI